MNWYIGTLHSGDVEVFKSSKTPTKTMLPFYVAASGPYESEAKARQQAFQGRRVLKNPSGVRIVYNRLLGGWYVVRGPHQTPLSGRFDTKYDAEQSLLQRQADRGVNMKRNPRQLSVPERHQLRLALDTIKYPDKALLGPPSFEEAIEIVKRLAPRQTKKNPLYTRASRGLPPNEESTRYPTLVGHATRVKVREPFKKSRMAWEYEGRRIFGQGPGAIVLDESKGLMLDIGTGAVYTDERFHSNPALMVIGNPRTKKNPESEIITLVDGYDRTKTPQRLSFRSFTMEDIRALGTTGQREFWFEDNQGKARKLRLASSLKTWKRDPDRFEATFKYGMYESTRMTTEEMLRRLLIPIEEKTNPSSDLMSDSVHEVRYTHRKDGAPYKHTFKPGVRMVANEDGTITMYHPTKRIHEEFPD